MHVLELARPMTDGVQILVLQREEVLREALVREAGAHALPRACSDPEPSSAGLGPAHGPGVRFVGRDVVGIQAEARAGRWGRRVVREPSQSVYSSFVADGTAATHSIEFI